MKYKIRQWGYGMVCICYLAILIYFLFFAEGFREQMSSEYHYNFIPFHEIGRYLQYYQTIGLPMVLLNLLGNILAFVPYGFFLPLLSHRKIGLWATTLFTFEFSVMVELIQLFTKVGSCDVDDVILNTLGGFLGYLIYLLREKREEIVDGQV